MAAVDQEQGQERPPVTQLEFRQAMRDFKTMFPEMDEDVIEVVLRSNNGAVDSTIDQLLTMSTDNENERLRTELDATENDELPPCYSPSTPPPSYNQAVPYAQSQSPAHASSTTTTTTAAASASTATTTTTTTTAASTATTTATASAAANSQSEDQASASLQPQLQPSQVVAVKPTASPAKISEPPAENCPDIPESAEESSPVDRPDTALKVLRDWNPPLLGELPPTFLKVPGMPIAKSNKKVTILSSTILQQRMEENERKRQSNTSANDPDLVQYLEDERIALFLQNKEFFQELKDNKEFLSTLERASSDVSSPEDEGEGDAAEGLDNNFPYCNNAPSEETDAAFREKIKNMGKVSRKKFTQLAKLFSRRKRRSFKPILGDGSNPSRDNLLLHEDEYSEASDDDSETEMNKKDTWNSHVGGPGGRSQTIERSKMDL